MSPITIVLIAAVVAAFYMAWNIGANDVANAMGTSVGSGALTLMAAVVLAGLFEFAGAALVGVRVTETIRKGIVEVTLFQPSGALGAEAPLILAIGMVAALLAAGFWLQVATMLGLPVSTTHSIVGAVIGFALVALGPAAVNWGTVGMIVASWVVSPMMGGLIAAGMFILVSHGILQRPDPVLATRKLGPHLVALVTFLLFLSFVYKALANVVPDPAWWLVVMTAGLLAGLAFLFARRWLDPIRVEVKPFDFVERVFARLQIVTAVYVAFAHGANDVANAIGPLAAVVQIHALGALPSKVQVPFWILALGGVGIVVGLATWGFKVIATVGKKIMRLTPTRGFSAEFGAATTVLIASRLGMPISTTHTLVGAVVGVGLARGLAALDLRVLGRIVNCWLATLPFAAILSALIFIIMRASLT